MENVVINKMSKEDFESIKNMLINDFDDFWSPSTLERELNNTNSLYFVAKFENEIIGFVGISNNIDFAEIVNIVVKKIYRNKGIGKKLLEKIIEEASKQNINKICLEVNECNENAIKLYNKFGFVQVGRRKKYYNENDAILMDLNLKN